MRSSTFASSSVACKQKKQQPFRRVNLCHAFIARQDGNPTPNPCAELHTCLVGDEPIPPCMGEDFFNSLPSTEKQLIWEALENMLNE